MRSVLIPLLLAFTQSANAATIGPAKTEGGKSIAGILIEGEILPGDFDRFTPEVIRRNNIDPIWLASPGGDMIEAVKIGELVRELKLSVWAPSKRGLLFPVVRRPANALCASACFYIFAAGVERGG